MAAAAPSPATGLQAVPAQMLAALQPFLPAAISGLPDPSVFIVTLNDAPVGIGSFIGAERRGPLAQVEVKGGRLDALVRFQTWGANATDLNVAVLDLQSRLLASADSLRSAGFLRFNSETSSSPQLDQPANAWNRTVDYRLLYEYRFDASDAAQSLIARIPVHVDQEVVNSPARENTIVTDKMARWDNLGALTLALRGRSAVHAIEALVFVAGTAPSGAVTMLRTFDGAPGPAGDQPSLAAFLAAVAAPVNTQRVARVVFPDLTTFLAQFAPVATPQTLGDWNLDSVLDEYSSYRLAIEPPIILPTSIDRLELTYGNGNEPFNQVAVAYLRLR